MVEDFQVIRLLFPIPAHEEMAVGFLRALASPLGGYADQVRPETRVEQIAAWAAIGGNDTAGFVTALESGAGTELDFLVDELEKMTFRELVENVCNRNI
jgi:hypothetical protein